VWECGGDAHVEFVFDRWPNSWRHAFFRVR